MSSPTIPNPELSGYLTENQKSPTFTYGGNGIELSHTYRASSIIDPAAFVSSYNWTIGAYHWRYSDGGVYSRIRFAGYSAAFDYGIDDFYTLTLNFAFSYSLTMNQYGEIWEYELNTEQVEIRSVTAKADQKCYTMADPSGSDGGELAIGVDGDTISGTQAYRPTTSLRISKVFAEKPENAFVKSLLSLRGKLNSSSFDLWSAKEVLFLGASLRKNNNGYWQCDYSFICAEKQSSASVKLANGTTANFSPEPFDYVWYKYIKSPAESGTQNGIQGVYVAKIYDAASFAPLGIGS